jgi:predicted neuraminidase
MSDSMDHKALIYHGVPPNHCCVGAALRIMPDGEWITFITTGGVNEPEIDNHVVLCRSTDRGEVWRSTEIVLRYPDRGCLFSEATVIGDRITLYVHSHDGHFGDWRNLVMESSDGGRTWTEPVPFEPMPHRAFFWAPCRMRDGALVLPFELFVPVNGDWDSSPLGEKDRLPSLNGALVSRDGGETWIESNRVGPTFGWAESSIAELSDGTLAMLIRADGTGHILRSGSRDGGLTWSEPVPTDIPNPGTKFQLHGLSDGRICLVHNPNSATSHPNSCPGAACHRNPLALWISDDDMESWGYRRDLTDFPGMLAYPDGVLEGDEWLHFAFDYNRHDVIYWGARLP